MVTGTDHLAPVELMVQGRGERTHLWRLGRPGVPLLLLHGAGPGIDAEQNWATVWDLLAANFDVIAPDLVGFGRTSRPADPPVGPRAWTDLRVQQVIDFLDALKIDRAWLVGNSRGGGAVALRLAIEHPDRLGGIVVMGAGGYDVERTPEAFSALQRAASAFYDAPSAGAMQKIIARFVADESSLPGPLATLAQTRLHRAMEPGAESAFRAMWTGDFSNASPPDVALAQITVPTLLLHGGSDVISPVANSVALRAAIGSAHLYVLPEAGHWLHVDQPTLFTQLVPAFVAAQTNEGNS